LFFTAVVPKTPTKKFDERNGNCILFFSLGFGFLLLEFWVFGFHVTPGHFAVRQVAHNSGNFIQLLFLNKKKVIG